MIPTLYKGSVKNILGPINTLPRFNSLGPLGALSEKQLSGYLFQYSDRFSVFDWGPLPQGIPQKGEALATLACDLFEKLEDPSTWLEFSKSSTALELRRGISKLPHASLPKGKQNGVETEERISISANFNELGERLQKQGLRTHYRGAVTESSYHSAKLDSRDPDCVESFSLAENTRRVSAMAVLPLAVVRPRSRTVLGKLVLDYHDTQAVLHTGTASLIPLEVVFRFQCPEGSSLLERVKRNPDYASNLALTNPIEPESKFEFPILELFTKLESTDRPVTFNEALSMTGLSSECLEEMLLRTAWVAGWLKHRFDRVGLLLADGKLEWGVEGSNLFLVDAIGPDELRILKGKTQLSKEFLRKFYRDSKWYAQLQEAKVEAQRRGISDWRSLVSIPTPELSPEMLESASQMYRLLTNSLTSKPYFEGLWSLDQLVQNVSRYM